MNKKIDQFNIPITKQKLKTRGIQGNTDIWLEEMSQRDTMLWGMPKPLWVVDNKMYDLSQFAPKHPGGSSWITLTKGQDISALFVTHHLEEAKVRSILEKYYVGEAPVKHEPRFDFNTSGHYPEIRRRILSKFSVRELQDSRKTEFRCYTLTVIWFVLLALCGYTRSYTLSILCGIFMLIFFGFGHLGIHRKDNNLLKYCYMLIGFSTKQQQIMHAISHHPYPNTLIDYQYSGTQPVMSFARCIQKGTWISVILLQLMYLVVGPGIPIAKLIIFPMIKKQKISWVHGFILLQILYLYIFSQQLLASVKLWLLMIFVYGFVFGKTITCSHRQIYLWSEGAPEIKDYVLHIIASTTDVCQQKMSPFTSLIFYAGLNLHVIHHMFPTIDHSKLPQCHQILMQYCKDKGINVTSSKSIWECNKNMLQLETTRQQFDMKLFQAK